MSLRSFASQHLAALVLAGLAVGLWSSRDEIAKLWQFDRRFEPSMSNDQRESLYDGWRRAVARARGEP